MPRVVRPFPRMQKGGKLQRHHQSRLGSRRTPTNHPVLRKLIMGHGQARLDDGVETDSANAFVGESPKSVPIYNYTGGTGSSSEIPKQLLGSSNGMCCGSEAESDQDLSIMNCNYISPNEFGKLGIPFDQVYQCDQCGKQVSDIISREHLLELERLFLNGNQSSWDPYTALTRSALIVDSGDLDYQHAREPTFGCSSGESSSETILGYGLTVRCIFCEYRFYLFYRSLGVMDHMSYLTPDSSPRSDSSLLQEQHMANTTMNIDGLLPGTNIEHQDPLFSLEAQTQGWNRQHDQEFTNEFQPDTPDDPNNTYNWGTSQSQDDTMVSPSEDYSISTGVETEVSPSAQSQQATANVQPNSDQATGMKKCWACPWYKKDPLKYHECSKYKLNRIKDVKQHTLRKHMKPDIYCPVCFKLFQTASERDGHIQKKNCESQDRPDFDGISEEQRKELNQIANRGKSDMDQWYCMWDAIFPKTRRPQSPHIGNGWEKLVPLLRNFWHKSQPEILSKALQVSLPGSEIQNIQRVVDKIFDLFEAESSCWGTNPDVSPENVPPKIKEEELPKSVASYGLVPQDLTQHQWDITPELQDPPLEQQVVLEADSNLEYMIGNHVNVNLDNQFDGQGLVTSTD